jgi:hypothetical protein
VIDVDGDGTDDLLTGGGVFRGDGRGGFESLSDTALLSFCENQSAGDDYCDVDVADFNDDRLSDLLSFPRIWTGVGSGAFVHAATIPSPNGSSWATHLIVDVNADGQPDIVAGDGTHRFAVFLNGSGRSSPNYQLK